MSHIIAEDPTKYYPNTQYALILGRDGESWRSVKVDANGNLAVGQTLDFTADIEITGTPVMSAGFTPASSGANIIVSIAAGERAKVYKAILSCSADITGEVYLVIGSTKIGSVQYPRQGGQYMLMSTFPDFYYGALGEDIIINLPSATTVSVILHYEVA